jgi:hypothetical protein
MAKGTVEEIVAGAAEAPAAEKLSMAAMDLELKRLELEDKQLEIKMKRANLVDTQERLAEREMRRENVLLKAKTNGQTIKQVNKNTRTLQNNCNHKKGGDGLQGLISGQGDSEQYAVLKHTFAAGNTEIRCMRCHKVWKKPLESDFQTPEGYQGAVAEYRVALNFQTKNKPSSSYTFGFSDQGQYFLENTRNAE